MRVACVGPLVKVVDGFLLVKTMKELEGLPLVMMIKVVGFFLLVMVMWMVGVFLLERMVPLVRTSREVWFSPFEWMMRVVGAVPLLSMLRALVKVEAVVLVWLVSVSLKTEYSPGKSCV